MTEGVEQDPLGDSVAAAALMTALGLVDAFLVYIEATSGAAGGTSGVEAAGAGAATSGVAAAGGAGC